MVRRELVLCAGIAVGMSLFVLVAVPPGGDLAAHLYRTLLTRPEAATQSRVAGIGSLTSPTTRFFTARRSGRPITVPGFAGRE